MAAVNSTAYEIAAAMRYLHSHNILHGDLTAGNVLLTSSPITARDQRGFTAKASHWHLSIAVGAPLLQADLATLVLLNAFWGFSGLQMTHIGRMSLFRRPST